MKRILFYIVIIFSWSNLFGTDFDPETDGWYFENWGEEGSYCIGSCDFSWDLFRQTYLGVNPTHDCLEAPLDCAFYEIFKNCAQKGNCGGMSLLALAIYKYGGFMGFCGPAKFFTGVKSPDREDLHRAVNILQARQFSTAGIENIMDIFDAGAINDANTAFATVEEALANGDYPLLSIANDYVGDAAHTVIPYKTEIFPSGNSYYGYPSGTKVMYIWDPNHPYDDDHSHYNSSSTANRLVIKSATDWTYTSGGNNYSGLGGGWCFCVPMSAILEKSRHPMAVDVLADALLTVFVGGPGAAINQIEDMEGLRFYKTDGDHSLRNEFESDPAKRLKGVIRWPWFAQRKADKNIVPRKNIAVRSKHNLPGELYFIRGSKGRVADLNFTLKGKKYEAVFGLNGNLVRIEAESAAPSIDRIRISRLAGAGQSLEIKTDGTQKTFKIKQLRSDASGKTWRSFEIANLKIVRSQPVQIQATGDMEALQVTGGGQKAEFELEIGQRLEGKTTIRKAGKILVLPDKQMSISPQNWRQLEKTKLIKETLKPNLRKK